MSNCCETVTVSLLISRIVGHTVALQASYVGGIQHACLFGAMQFNCAIFLVFLMLVSSIK
jgi:hypothetical protein